MASREPELAWCWFERPFLDTVFCSWQGTCAGGQHLTQEERQQRFRHLSGSRKALLALLLWPRLVRALAALSETWLGGRLLFSLLVRPLSLNSLNVRPDAAPPCSVGRTRPLRKDCWPPGA